MAGRKNRPVEYPGGVILYPPGNRNGWRVEWYDPPLRPDGGHQPGDRQQRYRRKEATARLVSEEASDAMMRKARGLVSEYRTGVSFSELADDYLDADNHTGCSENYADQQQSLARCWLLDDGAVCDGDGTLLRDVQVGKLTESHLAKVCNRVRRERAFGTYKNVHKLVVSILMWAHRQRFLPPSVNPTAGLPRPVERRSADVSDEYVEPAYIPTADDIADLRAAAVAADGERAGLLIDVLRYSGLREGEALALSADGRWDLDQHRVHITEQFNKGKVKPPKLRKERFAFVPPVLAQSIAELLDELADGELLFPAPRGGYDDPDNWRERRWNVWAEAAGWPEREDYCPYEFCGQNKRRWLWSPHALRHWTATWMLGPKPDGLGLDEEDVAYFLGHRDGVQVRRMYVRRRKDAHQRAAAAAASAMEAVT